MARTAPWIVVGGGASGLAAAFFLREHGLDSVILERADVLGGRMATVRLGDRVLDCGGKNIGRDYTLFRRFAASLGDHPLEHFGLNSSQAVDGQVRTFDGGARWRTMAGLVRGLPAKDVIRFAGMLAHVRASRDRGYLGSRYARALSRRFGADTIDRHFSPAFCARIIRPMTVRMNGAEPDEIFMGTLSSNVRMLLDSYEQFTHGLTPLLHAVADRYDVRLDTAAEELLIERGRVCGVRVRRADGTGETLRGAGVVLATPAPASAALTSPVLPTLSAALRSVSYYPVTLLLAEYDRPIFSPSVRAFVFGPDEPLSNAGAYSATDRHLVRYTFSGRPSRGLDGSTDPDALLRLGESALSKHVPVHPRWRRRFAVRHFNPGLCAYTPYHGAFLDRLGQQLQHAPGLHLTGDYVQGASIEACFRAASACVDRLARQERTAAQASARALLVTDNATLAGCGRRISAWQRRSS